jgi:hypothetical protein
MIADIYILVKLANGVWAIWSGGFIFFMISFHPQPSLHPPFFLVHMYKQNMSYLSEMLAFERMIKWNMSYLCGHCPTRYDLRHGPWKSVRSGFDKGGKDTRHSYILASLYCGPLFLKLSCMYEFFAPYMYSWIAISLLRKVISAIIWIWLLSIWLETPRWPAPPVQAAPQSSRCGPNRADRPQTSTTLRDLVIFTIRSAILIKHKLFSSFGQLFCYIIATVLNHSCYNAQSFLLQCLVIFSAVLNHFCKLGHSSLIQCPSIPSVTVLNHSRCNAQSF